METVSLADAKAQLSKLIDRVESGEEVVITRHGRAVARVTAVEQPKKPLDLDALAEARKRLPPWGGSSAKLLRKMRDEGY
ncbi:MAG TPA: type II toxin-antitoxin system prevent-host-death family antitoxin [Rhizomicrobium sp.]|jgi:prevent-host-death family protein|nr:type II toxin-antitoxin system prevent-host-death family antitoxin [Rhizomicrobium sp.]